MPLEREVRGATEEIADRLNLPETTSKKRAPTTLQDYIVAMPRSNLPRELDLLVTSEA